MDAEHSTRSLVAEDGTIVGRVFDLGDEKGRQRTAPNAQYNVEEIERLSSGCVLLRRPGSLNAKKSTYAIAGPATPEGRPLLTTWTTKRQALAEWQAKRAETDVEREAVAIRHSERFRKVSTRYARRVSEGYDGDLERAAADTDEQVATTVAAWEREHGLDPRDWAAIGAEERGDEEVAS